MDLRLSAAVGWKDSTVLSDVLFAVVSRMETVTRAGRRSICSTGLATCLLIRLHQTDTAAGRRAGPPSLTLTPGKVHTTLPMPLAAATAVNTRRVLTHCSHCARTRRSSVSVDAMCEVSHITRSIESDCSRCSRWCTTRPAPNGAPRDCYTVTHGLSVF